MFTRDLATLYSDVAPGSLESTVHTPQTFTTNAINTNVLGVGFLGLDIGLEF